MESSGSNWPYVLLLLVGLGALYAWKAHGWRPSFNGQMPAWAQRQKWWFVPFTWVVTALLVIWIVVPMMIGAFLELPEGNSWSRAKWGWPQSTVSQEIEPTPGTGQQPQTTPPAQVTPTPAPAPQVQTPAQPDPWFWEEAVEQLPPEIKGWHLVLMIALLVAGFILAAFKQWRASLLLIGIAALVPAVVLFGPAFLGLVRDVSRLRWYDLDPVQRAAIIIVLAFAIWALARAIQKTGPGWWSIGLLSAALILLIVAVSLRDNGKSQAQHFWTWLTTSSPKTHTPVRPTGREWGLAVAPTSPCNSREVSYTFEAQKPVGRPFNLNGQCGPALWHQGHCIWVQGYRHTTAVRLCDPVSLCTRDKPCGKEVPLNIEYAWSADGYAFTDKVRLDPPRNVQLIDWVARR